MISGSVSVVRAAVAFVLVVASAGATLMASALAGRGLAAAPQVEIVATGLEVPWALAWAPDGRLFVTERPGRIRVIENGRLDPTPLTTLAVAATGEAGLMGLALDPGFATNGHLYVCYTHGRTRGLLNRVSRLTLRERRARDERVLVDDIPGAAIHDGCRLGFGPDGKLYVGTGDAAEPSLAPRRESLAGKILRLNPDGTIPADNPFPGSPVYSLGHRNVQGLAWDAAGRLFASEHGSSAHDEVNRIEPGRNYGWPEVTGRAGGRERGRFVDPIAESGSETWAPSGIAVVGDAVYVAGLRGRRLLRIALSADRTEARIGTHLEGFGRLRDVVVGPDGKLYVATSNRDGRGSPAPDDDRILRVSP